MRKPESRTMEVSSIGIIKKLSSDLYRDLADALLELNTNGIDAASRIGLEPVIDVTFWEKGAHPLAPNATVLTILDNGCGMDEKALKGYFRLGESLFANEPGMHATHGLGRIAAFALGNQENLQTYFVISSCDDKQAWMFDVNPHTLFSTQASFTPVNRIDRRLKLPLMGSFTQILIPDYNPKLQPKKLAQKLTRLLPMRPWTVTVQGELVEHRKIQARAIETTPHIPALEGPVRFEFGTVERRGNRYEDPILFVDANTGRVVTDLKGIPVEVAREISAELFMPQVYGAVYVPGLERQSSSNRHDFNMSFWESDRGEALIDVLNSFGVETLLKLIGPQNSEGSRIDSALASISESLEKIFGKPEVPKSVLRKGTTQRTSQVLVKKKDRSDPPDPPTPNPDAPDQQDQPEKGKRNPPATKTGTGTDTDDKDNADLNKTETTEVDSFPGPKYIRLEGVTYQVAKVVYEPEEELSGLAPVETQRLRSMQIRINHPYLLRADRSEKIYSDALLFAVIEAHVISTRLASGDTEEKNNMLNDVYRIMESIVSKIK